MIKKLIFNLTLMMLLLTGCITTAQDTPQAFPADVVEEVQAKMDDLSAGELPPGMIVWIDAPDYRFEGASGFAGPHGRQPDAAGGRVPDW